MFALVGAANTDSHSTPTTHIERLLILAAHFLLSGYFARSVPCQWTIDLPCNALINNELVAFQIETALHWLAKASNVSANYHTCVGLPKPQYFFAFFLTVVIYTRYLGVSGDLG